MNFYFVVTLTLFNCPNHVEIIEGWEYSKWCDTYVEALEVDDECLKGN